MILKIRGGVEDTRLEAKDTKKFETKAKDSLTEDRHSRGQEQECSRPKPRTKDTSASVLQKKKVFTKIFQAISTKKRFPKNFSSAPQNFNNSKNSAVLEPKTGQFSRTRTWPSRPSPRTSKCVLEDVLEAKDVLEDSTSAKNLNVETFSKDLHNSIT